MREKSQIEIESVREPNCQLQTTLYSRLVRVFLACVCLWEFDQGLQNQTRCEYLALGLTLCGEYLV